MGSDRSFLFVIWFAQTASFFSCTPLSFISTKFLMHTVRLDKWLWAARFFKTRSIASRACDLGRIQSNNQPIKASRDVRVGDLLQIKTEGGDFEVRVASLSDVRGPASVAQTLYAETEQSRELRLKAAEARRTTRAFNPAPQSRPSKRDRRRIIQFRAKREP